MINLFLEVIAFLIILFGLINLLRMTLLLVGANLYYVRQKIKMRREGKATSFPSLSVIIPAYNEEKTISRATLSVIENKYPEEKLEVIVVDDGSNDGTRGIILDLINRTKDTNIKYVHQENSGKAHALNNGIKNYAAGELVMCLDADSFLEKNSLANAVKYFDDKKVVALASNVKVHRSKGILNLIQIFEYTLCYQMKKAHSLYNIEYIIGGIGSTFRKSMLDEIGHYDKNTVTEDIDMTMKILQKGNKNVKLVYASDVITYTQGALTLKDLIRQRYRWKWGRYQAFLKNKNLFLNFSRAHNKGLTWIYLPYALWADFAFFFEPALVLFVLGITVFFHDLFTLLSAFTVLTFYLSMSIINEDTLSFKERLILLVLAPSMYFLFYILSFVEYIALIRSWINMPKLKKSLDNNRNIWDPIKRFSYQIVN